jgi:dihydroorotase
MRGGILDEDGRVRKSVHAAMERGVVFDVGHGAGSFKWEVVERAFAQGVQPQTISSDLHVYNLHGPVYDLATVVTKFLHLGLSLDDAIAKVTAVPADTIRMPGHIGTLAPGAWGDAVLFELREGEFRLVDSHGSVRVGRQKLVPVTVVKGGRIYRKTRHA